MTTTFPELTPDQVAIALRTATPADPDAARRAQADAEAALDVAFGSIRTVAP